MRLIYTIIVCVTAIIILFVASMLFRRHGQNVLAERGRASSIENISKYHMNAFGA